MSQKPQIIKNSDSLFMNEEEFHQRRRISLNPKQNDFQ